MADETNKISMWTNLELNPIILNNEL